MRFGSVFICALAISLRWLTACGDEQLGPGDECQGSILSQKGPCPSGYYCDDSSTPWRCQKKKTAGEACAFGDVCPLGYFCDSRTIPSTCQELRSPSPDSEAGVDASETNVGDSGSDGAIDASDAATD